MFNYEIKLTEDTILGVIPVNKKYAYRFFMSQQFLFENPTELIPELW